MNATLTDLSKEHLYRPSNLMRHFLHNPWIQFSMVCSTFFVHMQLARKGSLNLSLSEKQIAALFDDMVSLVKAVGLLREIVE